MKHPVAVAAVVAGVALAVQQLAWRRGADVDGDAEAARVDYWRARIAIIGRGRVQAPRSSIDCSRDRECGPALVVFDERTPPLLTAVGAPGWRFDHWESSRRGVATRADAYYVNGRDAEADTETVTAVFVQQ